MNRASHLLLTLVLCALILDSASAVHLEAQCTACKCIARELEWRISQEKPRNALDMRHRLDSTGQRYGRVISYKESELRATELLEDLCKTMKDYTLVKSNTSDPIVRYWAKVKGENKDAMENVTRSSHDEESHMTKKLENYCGSVLEDHEDEVTEALMKLKLEERGSVSPFLCNDLVKACPQHQSKHKKAEKENKAEREKSGERASEL